MDVYRDAGELPSSHTTVERVLYLRRANVSELVREQIFLRHILGMDSNCRLEQVRAVVVCGIHHGRNFDSRQPFIRTRLEDLLQCLPLVNLWIEPSLLS